MQSATMRDMQADKLNYATWEDQIAWGDDDLVDDNVEIGGENVKNGYGMDVDEQDKARKNTDKISGSRNLLEIKKTKERLRQIRENTPSIGMNVGLKDKAWLNTVKLKDTDQHRKQKCETEKPIKLDYTDPA